MQRRRSLQRSCGCARHPSTAIATHWGRAKSAAALAAASTAALATSTESSETVPPMLCHGCLRRLPMRWDNRCANRGRSRDGAAQQCVTASACAAVAAFDAVSVTRIRTRISMRTPDNSSGREQVSQYVAPCRKCAKLAQGPTRNITLYPQTHTREAQW